MTVKDFTDSFVGMMSDIKIFQVMQKGTSKVLYQGEADSIWLRQEIKERTVHRWSVHAKRGQAFKYIILLVE